MTPSADPMRPRFAARRLAVAVGVAAIVAGLAWFAASPRTPPSRTLSGYVEGEALYLAAPVSGPVSDVRVVRGQRVRTGDVVFSIDSRPLAAQQGQATAELAQARAQVEASSAGVRQWLAVAASARATADNAALDARRMKSLTMNGAGAVSQQDTDRAQATAAASAAQFRAVEAQADAAAALLASARQQVRKTLESLSDIATRMDYLSPRAPGPAVVEQVFFQTGEWAPSNQPVVSLLPDEKVKVRFFVPEQDLRAYSLGRTVRFACDGCRGPSSAVIDYVSPRPEYTPPVIYSRQTRDSLVFMVEARPMAPRGLTPGQPVDVSPLAGSGAKP